MIKASIRVDLDVLDAVADTARQSPKLMETAMKRQVGRLRKQIKDQFPIPDPGAVQYKATTVDGQPGLRWKNRRQQRAFFASRGFGKGIPYQRENPGIRGDYDVRVKNDEDGGILELINTNPAAPFVIGEFQQPYHADTGWETIDKTAARYSDLATDEIIDIWFTVADPVVR